MLNLDSGGVKIPPRILPKHMTFGGLFMDGQGPPVYPKWLYKAGEDPRKVHSTAEEQEAKANGWDNVQAGQMANRTLTNWFWDLEDMSSKQLCVYAKDEFGVDLPENANQDKLFMAVTELIKYSPQNRNRLVLMAHTMKMNYDETLEEIRCMIRGERQGMENETFTEEFWA